MYSYERKAPWARSLGRRQSPCQQAQVMINVLKYSSRSPLRSIPGTPSALSSGRNVLGILAQCTTIYTPSPSRTFPHRSPIQNE